MDPTAIETGSQRPRLRRASSQRPARAQPNSTAPCLNEDCLRAARLTHRRRTPFEPMATIAAGTVKPCVFKEAQSVSEQEQKPAKLRIAAGFQNRFAHQSPY